MISHRMGMASAESPRKIDLRDDNSDHGPMLLQNALGSRGPEMHPQEFVRLVGCCDSTKHEVAHRLH